MDEVITANRESIADVKTYRDVQAVLNEIFNEARQRYEDHQRGEQKKTLNTREEHRTWVPERLVEYPTADALTMYSQDFEGTEPDGSWMYLDIDPETDIASLTETLYSQRGRNQAYIYQYVARGRGERLVKFDPANITFNVNQDHELVVAYGNEPGAQRLLQDLVTSEALLEVYLREAGVRPHAIGEVLERRDLLLRGLADTHMFSLPALSTYIKGSASNSTDLEIAVVAGARALGFVAKHISGSGEPDGVARFTDFPHGEQKIVLEAKSSIDIPSAKDIDFAAINNHVNKYQADGCLLVAPGYPGGADGNVAQSAKDLSVSCWTVGDFADVIGGAEARQIAARQILDIVRTKFAPDEVSQAVRELLADPTWEPRSLYLAVVEALRNIHGKLATSTTVADLTGGVCNGIGGLWLGGAVSTTTRTG